MNRMVVVVAAMLVTEAVGAVSTLSIGDLKVEGNQVEIPIVLGGNVGGGVSAMDFHLNYNPEALQPVSASAGGMAALADKRVMANVGAPGEYVVVMMGMNQAACAPGELAKVVMQRTGGSSESNWGLGITGQTLSASNGAVMESQALPFTFHSNGDPVESDPKVETAKAESPDSKRSMSTADRGRQAPATESPASENPEVAAPKAAESERLRRLLAEKDRVRSGIGAMGAGRPEPKTDVRPGIEQPGSDVNKSIPAGVEPAVPIVQAENTPKTVESVASNTSVASDASPVETGGKSPRRLLAWMAAFFIFGAGLAGWLIMRGRLFSSVLPPKRGCKSSADL